MMFEISVKGDIASAHFIPGYEGLCKNLHGHTWKIEVVIQSEKLNSLGMVADFSMLKKKLKEFLMPLDHACLNDLPHFKNVLPTTENIAQYIYQGFTKTLAPLKVKHVEVWESDTSSVIYYE